MHRLICLAAMMFAVSGPARAEWVIEAGEDPMTDQKWAAAGAVFSEQGYPKVLFKCWAASAEHIQLGIIVGEYNDAASYPSSVTAKFRVDKNPPVEIRTYPMNLGGSLMLTATNDIEPELPSLLKSIYDSTSRVALSVGDTVYQSDVRGTSKAIGAMFKICGIESNATGEWQLDREQCATVLEAVKACEALHDCSSAAVENHFAARKAEFEAMTGDSVFTTEKLNEQCAQTCRQKDYRLAPVRQELCGY